MNGKEVVDDALLLTNFYCPYCCTTINGNCEKFCEHYQNNHVKTESETICPVCDQGSFTKPVKKILSHMKKYHSKHCRLCTQFVEEKNYRYAFIEHACNCTHPLKDFIMNCIIKIDLQK